MTALPPGSFEAALAERPDIVAHWRAAADRLWDGRVDPVLLELCRIRVAQLLGDRAGAAERTPQAGDLEPLIGALPRWPDDPAFSTVQRCALAVAEGFVLAHHDLTDADVAALGEHLSPAEVVALVAAVAFADAASGVRIALAAPEAP